jgi:phage terminase small subunit
MLGQAAIFAIVAPMSDVIDESLPALEAQCSPKEILFVREYVQDLNGTLAVVRSGAFAITSKESAGVCAANLLARPRVKALVEKHMAQRALRLQMTADAVVMELSLLSHSNIDHYLIDDNGAITLRAGAPEGAMAAIQSFKRKKTVKEDKDGGVTITYDVEIKLWDKPAPLKLIGKHVGIFPDKVEHTGKDGGPIETVTEVKRVVVRPTVKQE